MTNQTTSAFDISEFKRGYEQWDIEALLSGYADDVEQIQMDDAAPPSSPVVHQGKAALEQMFRHCKEHGVTATVANTVVGADRAAATVTCAFPGGRTIVSNVILELRDGRIVREHVTTARDE
jgi:ketosteroid isomerase-like protein